MNEWVNCRLSLAPPLPDNRKSTSCEWQKIIDRNKAEGNIADGSIVELIVSAGRLAKMLALHHL